jgi:RNA polymerase sigma factor (sigma-70 family)
MTDSTRDSEHDLVLAARAGGPDERAQLVEACLPHIKTVARRYRGVPGIEQAELFQEGVVGLLRALERFDSELGTPFWPYATWWVRQAMQRLISERSAPVVLSDRASRQLMRIRRAHQRWSQEHAREPSLAELADAAGTTRAQVQSLLAVQRMPRDLDEWADPDGARGMSSGERLADPRAEDPYDRVPETVAAEVLPKVLAGLTPRERRIIRGRFGLDDAEQTLRELARELEISAERVRQIEERALEKLRAAEWSPRPVNGSASEGQELVAS